MSGSVRRFACTKCGNCCNRAPEVELSEAAGLADVFVFRLMFRVYSLPRQFEAGRSETSRDFYAKKRLLNAHAARVSPRRLVHDGRPVDHLDYLMISALSIDTAPGSCTALSSSNCSIYGRRPLACRTVPFHYARAESSAERDLDIFVTTPRYRCDVADSAPVVIESGTLVDPGTRAARSEAMVIVERDKPWKEAIVRAMKTPSNDSLPRLEDVSANAQFGATTTSMRVAWQIAAETGLMRKDETTTLVKTQLATIERELENGRTTRDDRQTLREMEAEYRLALGS